MSSSSEQGLWSLPGQEHSSCRQGSSSTWAGADPGGRLSWGGMGMKRRRRTEYQMYAGWTTSPLLGRKSHWEHLAYSQESVPSLAAQIESPRSAAVHLGTARLCSAVWAGVDLGGRGFGHRLPDNSGPGGSPSCGRLEVSGRCLGLPLPSTWGRASQDPSLGFQNIEKTILSFRAGGGQAGKFCHFRRPVGSQNIGWVSRFHFGERIFPISLPSLSSPLCLEYLVRQTL